MLPVLTNMFMIIWVSGYKCIVSLILQILKLKLSKIIHCVFFLIIYHLFDAFEVSIIPIHFITQFTLIITLQVNYQHYAFFSKVEQARYQISSCYTSYFLQRFGSIMLSISPGFSTARKQIRSWVQGSFLFCFVF